VNTYSSGFSDDKLLADNSQFGLSPEIELKFAEFLINQAVDAAFCLGKKAQFLYVNNATCRLTEYSYEELLKLTLNDIDIFFSEYEWLEQLRYLTSHSYLTFKSRYRTKKGRIILVQVKINYLVYQGQEFICASAMKNNDETQLLEMIMQKFTSTELELSDFLEKTRIFRTNKHDFVSTVYNQFITTLNVISLSNSLIKRHIDEWDSEKINPFINHIQTGVEKLTQILNDLLILAKIESEKNDLDKTPIDLVSFSQDLVMKFSSNKHNPIKFISRDKFLMAQIDQNILEQILYNLLDNAIKYSPIGNPIDLTLSYEIEKVKFQVKDRGIGIPDLDLNRLFEPFYRGSNIGNIPGNGLGLTIVKSLVESHGGQIEVVSEVGFGTELIVTLPTIISIT
jgi:PAS domain S-box-containing protein